MTLRTIGRTVNRSAWGKTLSVLVPTHGGTLAAMSFADEVMSTFAKKLGQAREKAGYRSMKEFAEALGVEPPAYRHWERGTAQPDLTTLTRICRLLDIEPNDLLPLARRKRPVESDDRSAA